MIILAATTDKLQLVTAQAATVDVHVSYADVSSTTFATTDVNKQNTAITTATTTDILAVPGASTRRNVKQITVRNKDASNFVTVTVQYNQNATIFELVSQTLLPGETLEFVEGVGFFVIKASVNDQRTLTFTEGDLTQRCARSILPTVASTTFLMISGTAYYVYVGRVVRSTVVKFVEFETTTPAAAGTQTAELGLFSTPSAPNKSGQTLTKIVATGTVDSLTTSAVKRNTASFAQAIDAGTHLWAAFRVAMATTQPTVREGLFNDQSQGHVLTTTGGGALTGLTTASGTIPALAATAIAPALKVLLD